MGKNFKMKETGYPPLISIKQNLYRIKTTGMEICTRGMQKKESFYPENITSLL
jgi:hypothetical protein